MPEPCTTSTGKLLHAAHRAGVARALENLWKGQPDTCVWILVLEDDVLLILLILLATHPEALVAGEAKRAVG